MALGMEKVGDFWVPRADVRSARNRRKTEEAFAGRDGPTAPIARALDIIRAEAPDLPLQDMIAVDGGANVGSYTRFLARHFARVISLEPAPDAFACLERNVYDWGILPKVQHYMAALSDRRDFIRMGKGFGRRSITSAIAGKGDIPAIPLDSLGLRNVGLLKLDVEGVEEKALIGAANLLATSRPYVFMEVKQDDPGDPLAAHRYLCTLGYEVIEKLARNWIYRPI